ncbi:unnamed protein product, partial [Brachionus calyciflorus]
SLSGYRYSSIDSEIEIPKDIPSFNYNIDRDIEGIDSNFQIEKIDNENFLSLNDEISLNQGNFLCNSKISQRDIEDLEDPTSTNS